MTEKKAANKPFPKTGEFDTPAMRRIALDLPMTSLDKKLYGDPQTRARRYRSQLGDYIFNKTSEEIVSAAKKGGVNSTK